MNALAPAAPKRIVVGIADARASADPHQEIVTHALGSCVGIVLYDPVVRIAGLLHAMLPEIATAPHKAARNPAMFVESGLPHLLEMISRMGAVRQRLVVKAGGGAHVTANTSGTDYFKIGDRNVTALRRALWKAGLLLKASDVGGNMSRTMVVRVGNGDITLSGEGGTRKL